MPPAALASLLLVAALATGAPAPLGAAREGGTAAPARAETSTSLTQEEALALAFPDCSIERRTFYLEKEHVKRVRELAKGDFEQAIVHAYVATKDGKPVGTAYFDVHRVRTLKECLMIVVSPDERVQRIEILSFAEPPEYVPRASWYAQFHGKQLDDELELKRGIRGVAGATITARVTTAAVRRVLAVHAVVREMDAGSTEAVSVAPRPRATGV